MRKDAVLEMHGICKYFPGVRALQDVDFTLRKGEIHALMGENGAGKSTLIKVLTGVYAKDGGEVHIEGVDGPAVIRSPQDAQILKDPACPLVHLLPAGQGSLRAADIHVLRHAQVGAKGNFLIDGTDTRVLGILG